MAAAQTGMLITVSKPDMYVIAAFGTVSVPSFSAWMVYWGVMIVPLSW
jgi:hypothetical protein